MKDQPGRVQWITCPGCGQPCGVVGHVGDDRYKMLSCPRCAGLSGPAQRDWMVPLAYVAYVVMAVAVALILGIFLGELVTKRAMHTSHTAADRQTDVWDGPAHLHPRKGTP